METTQNGNGPRHKNGAGSEELLFSESVPEGLERSGNGLLSLKDIQIRLETDYSRLVRLANAPGVGELVGAVNVPGAKGVRYEPRALDLFRQLIAASDAKDLTPGTAAAWLKANEGKFSTDEAAGPNAITGKSQFGNGTDALEITPKSLGGLMTLLAPLAALPAAIQDFAAAVREFKSARAAEQLPAPLADRLLTAEEAAALLACKPRSVGHRVPPVSENPRRYRESDVLRHIQQLQPIVKK